MAPVATSDFDANILELKQQRASRRAVSLSKDKTHYKKQSEVSSKTGRKGSAAPVGSDSTNPHSAARAATRTCLAQGAISGSSDMPQISMGRAGSKWVRWVRKPSACKVGDEQPSMEELEMDELLIAAAVRESQLRRNMARACDAPAAPMPVFLFQADLGDQMHFPALAITETKPAPQVLQGARASAGGHDVKDAVPTAEVTTFMSPENFADEAVHEDECTEEQETEHNGELTPEKFPQSEPQQQAVADELSEDWIVVASDDATTAAISLSLVAKASFDGQHPRNAFAKKTASKRTASAADSQGAGSGIDWSQAGMPTNLLRRLIRGNVNDAHHGVQAQSKPAVPTPIHIMHAQNIGSSKRERSTPTTPRSHSKSRTMRQTSRGR